MRKILILMFLVNSLLISFQAIGSEVEDRIRVQTNAMLDAFVKHKFDAYADFVYPREIELSGGRQEFLYNIQQQINILTKRKMEITSYKIYSISAPIKAGGELHSVIRCAILISSPGGKIFSKEYFVVSSNDGGKQWKFVDGEFLSQTAANNVFPAFNTALELPDESLSFLRLMRAAKPQNNRQFIDLNAYLKLPKDAQELYAAGLTDAFIYLSEKTGHMEGLEKCFVDNKATASVVAKAIQAAAESWVKKQPGKPVEIAKLYERAHQKMCSKFIK